MCEDECDGDPGLCTGIFTGFTCVMDDAGDSASFCVPPSASTACVPASQFVHGTKPTGTCCQQTGDATEGHECLSGNCGQTGDATNPFICENVCNTPKDCAAN